MLNGVDRRSAPPKRSVAGADVSAARLRRGATEENVRNVHLLGRLAGVTAAQAEPTWADHRPLKERDGPVSRNWRVGLLPFKETFPQHPAGHLDSLRRRRCCR
jgi:hypothetical protein